MQLYYSPGTIASASAIALHEAGLAFTPIRVDFKTNEQRQAPYLALNPKGRVPVLVTESGVLTETGAILEFIAAQAPEAGLVPKDPMARARMHEIMYYLASTMHPNHAHKLRGARWSDDPAAWASMTAKVPETMSASCAYVEEVIQGPFTLGPDVTLADCYLYAISTWLSGDGVDITSFPKLHQLHIAMAARPSVRAAAQMGVFGQ